MDALKTYLRGLPDDEAREAFAGRCGTSLGHLRNCSNGYRPCAPELAVSIERESARAVRRWDVRPEDWYRIWPELIGTEGAPAVPTPDAQPAAA